MHVRPLSTLTILCKEALLNARKRRFTPVVNAARKRTLPLLCGETIRSTVHLFEL